MELYLSLTGFINFITSLVLGVFILRKNIKSNINKTFSFFCFSVTAWSFFYIFWPIAQDKESALLWFRLLHIGAIFCPLAAAHFTFVWLGQYKKRRKILTLGYIIAFFFVSIIFTPLFIRDMVPKSIFSFWAEPGILYHFYLLYFFSYITYACFLMFRQLKYSTGIQRTQIKFVLIGLIAAFLGGSTNYFLFYNIPIPPVANSLVLVYIGATAYAILKYRLMDIRFVLGKGAVYGLSLITIIGLAFLLMIFGNRFLASVPFNVIGSSILIISILLFQPVFRFFENFASKYFFYTFYSYQKVLTDLGRGLTRYLDLNKLSSLIISTLMDTMKLDRTVLLTREPGNGDYRIQKNVGFREENGISLVKDNFLTIYLEKTQKPLVYEELSFIIRDAASREEKEKMEKLKKSMKRIEAVLCLPLLIEGKIIGMIVLGNKISGDPYSEQDINLLANLSNQTSIALQNATLYSEIQGFSQKLEKEVEARTAELREAYEEVKKLDSAKSEFLSIASHQLRTPLTAVKGYISMMLERTYGKPPEKMKKPLENIYASNERLIKLVNDLLNVSRIEAGKMEVEPEKTSIEEMVKSVAEELINKAEKKGIRLKIEKPDKPLPKISVDKEKIRQVILNIIDNAIRYTNQGDVTVKTQIANSQLQIIVSDTGEGMTKEEISQLFKSFSRGKTGTRLWTEGAGLGLYVAKKFVDMHQGEIRAESKGKGKGSTLHIELPIE